MMMKKTNKGKEKDWFDIEGKKSCFLYYQLTSINISPVGFLFGANLIQQVVVF